MTVLKKSAALTTAILTALSMTEVFGASAASDSDATLEELTGAGASKVLEVYADEVRSGVATVVSDDGYLVTKYSDVARIEGPFEVKLGTRYLLPRIVKILPDVDLLILKISGHKLPSVTWEAEAEPARMGDWLVSLGATVEEASLGVVSAKTREIKAKKAALGIMMVNLNREVAKNGVTIEQVFPATPA